MDNMQKLEQLYIADYKRWYHCSLEQATILAQQALTPRPVRIVCEGVKL